MMDATTGFDAGAEQASQVDPDTLYAEFMARAKALKSGALVGMDALISEIAMSELPLLTFEDLAAAIAEATGGDKMAIVAQIFKGRWATRGETTAIPELPPDYRRLEAIPTRMTEAQALVEMNARLAYVHQAGEESAVLYFGPHRVELRALKDLREGLANRMVLTKKVDSKGDEHTTPVRVVDWWHAHPERRSYERTVFRPQRPYAHDGAPLPTLDTENEYNLWTGFERAPQRGSWWRLRWHLWALVCRRNQANFKYLLRWMAHMVQHPDRSPGVVVVLKSQREGTGKTTIGEVLSRLVGARHAITLRTPEDLLGNFNGNLAQKIFILLDEISFPGEHAQTRKLRSAITASTWTINEKYRRAYEIANVAHIMMTTNAMWAVHAGDQARRFFVLDVDDCWAGDREYFTRLWAELDQGGIEAMLHQLNRISLAGWHPQHDMPRTAALAAQQILSAGVHTRWAMDAALNGGFVTKQPAGFMELDPTVWRKEHSTRTIMEAVQAFARAANIREPVTSVATGRWLARCGFARRVSVGVPHWTIPDRAAFVHAVKREGGIT